MVIYFLVFLSNSFNTSLDLSMNAADCLRIDTAHVLIPFMILPPLSFDLNSFLNLRKYSFDRSVFISLCITLSGSKIPRYL